MNHKREKKHSHNKGKKLTSKNNNLVEIETEQFSSKDTNLLEESFNLIKNLNKEVTKVQNVKEKLHKDINKLDTKISEHEQKTKNTFPNKLFLTIKEDIIKEFTPILEKFDFKSVKVDVFKEISEIIDIEVQKLKTELESKTRKTKNDLNKKLSELEIRLIDALKSNEIIKKELKKFESSQINLLLKELEQKIHNAIEKTDKKSLSLFNTNAKDIEELKLQLQLQKTLSSELSEKILSSKKNTEKTLLTKFDNLKELISSDVKENSYHIFSKANKKIENSLLELNSQKTELTKDIDSFKIEISSLIKNYIGELDTQLNTLKNTDKTSKIESKLKKFTSETSAIIQNLETEKKKERDYIAQKVNETIDNFNTLSTKNRQETEILKKVLETNVKTSISEHIKNSEEEFARQTLSINDYFSRTSIETKENRRRLSEDIESKFITAKEQYEASFDSHLLSFDTKLKEKESDFLNKLVSIENEKNQMLKELDDFKEEISILTKEYVSKLDEELKKIKSEETDFAKEKEEFLSRVLGIIDIKKTELEDHADTLKTNLATTINKEKEIFQRHENTFRDVFNDKILNLTDYTKKRLDSVEKKFIEKNLKIVTDRIKEELKTLQLTEEKLTSKEEELDKKFETIDKKESDFYVQLDSELANLKEKIEERLIGLEKQLNKRFLDYDMNFSTFKGVIIDEVEDLMKSVSSLIDSKTQAFDKNMTKINFIINEVTNRVNDFKTIQETIENENRDLRDEINDLRVKFEITSPEHHTMSDHVEYMSEYENQIIALIKSLKAKSVPETSIKQALINKGHPRFYISMILENFDEILN